MSSLAKRKEPDVTGVNLTAPSIGGLLAEIKLSPILFRPRLQLFPKKSNGPSISLLFSEIRFVDTTRLRAESIANAIRAIKSDQAGPRLQREFFEAAEHSNDTKQ